VESCDFLVDLVDPDQISPNQPNYSEDKQRWTLLSRNDFLNSKRSHPFFRAFYIPWFSSQYTTYNSYVLLQRKSKEKIKRRGKEFLDEDDL